MQISQSQSERDMAVQIEKYENLERQQSEFIKSLEEQNKQLQDRNNELNEALSQGEMGIRDEIEHWKGNYFELERKHADLQSELDKEKALWKGKFDFLDKQKE